MKGVFFIAEIGLNHNGDINLAKKMIIAAKECGADAVKFQSICADKLVSPEYFSQPIDDFGFNDVKTKGDFWKKVSIDKEFHAKLSLCCKEIDIEFMSTPFDFENTDLLNELGVKRFKVASGDITNFPLLAYVAHKKKPIILSTGASRIDEIKESIEFIKKNGCKDITLLHCVALYPTPAKLANLNAISYLKSIFNLPIGFSDHTIGYHIPIAAIALGAIFIEKHFTIDKNLPGPDQRMSAEPDEFKDMIKLGKEVYEATIEIGKKVSIKEHSMRNKIRRSIVVARALKKGHIIQAEDLDFKRPGNGLSAKYFEKFIGLKLNKDVAEDELFDWDFIVES